MKLTTRGRYAVTALLDLVIHQQTGPIKITEVADRHSISVAYLERLAGLMRAKGLLKSVRGAKGGYVLGRPADKITVADVIEAVEEGIDTTRCQGKGNCHKGTLCLTHYLWEDLNHKIFDFLQGVTIGALARRSHVAVVRKINLQLVGAEHA